MTDPRADYRLTFVFADTGRPFRWRDARSPKPYSADTTCRDTTFARVRDRCVAMLPRIALAAGVDPAHIQGRITELVPAVGTAEFPVDAALLT